MHPVTRQIIQAGAQASAVDAFTAFYKLEELRRVADLTFRQIDALVLPTAPTTYTVEQIQADPVQLNSQLGTYTNFVNLLDLCGLAVPSTLRADGTPFGVTLLAPAGQDALLASIGRTFHAGTGLAARRARRAAAAAGAAGRRCVRTRSRSRSSARICRACRSTANCSAWAHVSSKRPSRPRTIGCSRCRGRNRRSPDCCASRRTTAPRSRSSCGR